MSAGGAPHPIATAMLRWLDELATEGVFTTDRFLTICTWNKCLEQQTGRPASAMVGRSLLHEFPDLIDRGLDAHFRAALEGEPRVLAHSFHGYVFPAPEGAAKPAQTARIAPLEHDGEIIGTITLIEDVSERIARERELRRQIEAAEFARALAEEAVRTKDEFLATLSHEIRTPLNAVIGWTKILQTRGADAATLTRALAVIDRNATAQMHLIDDMLDMARIMSGKLRIDLQPTDLREVVAAAVDVIAPTVKAKGLTVQVHVDPGEYRVAGDADRLQQVIWNLLSNSVKFTEAGGEVHVRLGRDGDAVSLVVSDTGAGIPPEFMPHMFDRFRQAHASSSRRQGGLGLGLPLVKHLVELHGGAVTAASTLGRGSTFTVKLPRFDAGPLLEGPPPLEERTPSLEGVTVLVVEDQDDARELTVAALQQYGAAVREVSTCAAALEAVDASLESGDVLHAIVADIGLPDEDGYHLIEQLRNRPPSRGGSVPVIALTAYALPRDRQRALAAGFRAHLVKPLDPAHLAGALRQVLPPAGPVNPLVR